MMVEGFEDIGGPGLAQPLRSWPEEQVAYFKWQGFWNNTRRDNQVPPEDEWDIWNILAGRGFGKTRVGAEWIARQAINSPDTRWLVCAPTSSDLRGTCFEGESGLLSVIPKDLIVPTKTGGLYNASLCELRVKCRDGESTSLIKGISAEEPERFRGPQFHGGWLDELAAWKYLQATWDMIAFTMRLGDAPKLVVTTTPRPKPLITQLADNKIVGARTVSTRGSSRENFSNLAPTFRQKLMQYEGTQLGRQEIDGEILDAEEGGVIRRSWFQLWPAHFPLPAFDEIILSLDTALTEESRDSKTGDADFTAATVWGVFTRKPNPKKEPQINIILLDAWHERMGFPDLIDRVKKELDSTYGGSEQKPVFKPAFGPKNIHGAGRKVDTIIIEDKGSGISLRQTLARENIFAHAYNPGRADKLARLHAVSHIAHAGIIYLWESEINPGQARDWCNPFLAEVCTFSGKGSTQHDDYVDSFSQAIRYIGDRFRMRSVPLTKQEKEDAAEAKDALLEAAKKAKVNPYAT
jgi:predicted phage terminase large subunit-like protein